MGWTAGRRDVAEPSGFSVLVYKCDTDGHVWLLIGKGCELALGLVRDFNPGFFQLDEVDIAGFDFGHLLFGNSSEASHHLDEENRAKAFILATGSPADGGKRSPFPGRLGIFRLLSRSSLTH